LGENAFEVRFQGGAYDSQERASDFALLRAAELTLEKGFKYFVIDNDENTQQTGVFSTANYYGSSTFTVSEPASRKVIVCFEEKPDWPGLIYDAQFVVQSVKEKYETEFNDARAEAIE